MYHCSTQRDNWTFNGKEDLERIREKTNQTYRSKQSSKLKINSNSYLTTEEELKFLQYYENRLRDFCRYFKPPLPPNVAATALMYLKRFYLRTSCMDYHPRFISFTCLWLAAKVEEYNISISQFVENLKQNSTESKKSEDLILALELPVIHALKYHLTIHNPFRPLEGFLIDLRTRSQTIENVDILRQSAEEFLNKVLKTDAGLLFPPSVIAISALIVAASHNNVTINEYVLEMLFENQPPSAFDVFKGQVKKIRSLVKKSDKDVLPSPEIIAQLKSKLEKCRNPDFTEQNLLIFVDEDEEGMSVEIISADDLLDF